MIKKVNVCLMLILGFVWWQGSYSAERLKMSNLADNSCTGSYFDITAKQHAVTVNGLGLFLAPGTHRLELYRKMGSYVGAQTYADSWEKLASKQVRSNGYDRLTRFDMSDFTVAAHQTTGLMVVSSHSLFYSNSLDTDAYVENNDIVIYANDAVCGEAFANSIADRVFNGAIYYNESICFPVIQHRQAGKLVTQICL